MLDNNLDNTLGATHTLDCQIYIRTVIGLWWVCDRFVVGLWWVYDRFVVGLWWVYDRSAVVILQICYRLAIEIETYESAIFIIHIPYIVFIDLLRMIEKKGNIIQLYCVKSNGTL